MRPRYETRDDGWPLCPVCGEDELFSILHWNGDGERPPMQAWIDAGLRCYKCSYDSSWICLVCHKIHGRETNAPIQCGVCHKIVGCFWHNRNSEHIRACQRKKAGLSPLPSLWSEEV